MLRFKDLGLAIKIAMVVLLPYTGGIIIASWSAYNAFENTKLLKASRENSRSVETVTDMSLAAMELSNSLRGLVLTGDSVFITRFDEAMAAIKQTMATLQKTYKEGSEEAKTLSQARKTLAGWEQSAAKPILDGSRKGNTSEVASGLLMGEKATQDFQAFVALTKKLSQQWRELLSQQNRQAERNSRQTMTVLSWGMLAIATTAILLIFVVSRGIVRPIQQAVGLAEAISGGDLSRRLDVRGNDEIGRLGSSLNTMILNLREQIGGLRESIIVLSSAAAEISATVSQVVSNASQTTTAVAETSTTVEQVKQAARMANEKAKGVADGAQESVQTSMDGSKATEEAVNKIALVKDQMETISETVVRLSDHSLTIEQIVGTVQDISDQSNLLAVNASIEAARAGDHGKGFSVVAHEIKNLADQSKEATGRIRAILEETRQWVSAVVMATEQGSKSVQAGVRQSARAGESIKLLADAVLASSQAASMIQTTSEQQTTGVEQVALAMGNIQTAVQQNLSSMNQLRDSAARLETLGGELEQLVKYYSL